jgi:serine/threonine protein kinase
VHRLGYCYRDLSIENAVILEDGVTLRIIDLGSCWRLPLSPAGDVLPFPAGYVAFGKPPYMAPEVCCRCFDAVVSVYCGRVVGAEV